MYRDRKGLGLVLALVALVYGTACAGLPGSTLPGLREDGDLDRLLPYSLASMYSAMLYTDWQP
ncbi:hypothetical protein HaLaN_23510 [Haematococcus lacustris]|uniref:Uncharacterized protein n=1 Tax=Haematococcus lacustris TaxID=44745 RepID=A0A699ZWH0_HAELA|nr:hypothetical protein HaLaN_23510 [Haematococcus lacustris]